VPEDDLPFPSLPFPEQWKGHIYLSSSNDLFDLIVNLSYMSCVELFISQWEWDSSYVLVRSDRCSNSTSNEINKYISIVSHSFLAATHTGLLMESVNNIVRSKEKVADQGTKDNTNNDIPIETHGNQHQQISGSHLNRVQH
jgi:hypothetical protein